MTSRPGHPPEHGRAPAPDRAVDSAQGSVGRGCLEASQLLRRRIHRYRQAGMGDEQALLAVCGVLDALARDSAARPGAVPGAVAHAVGRLVDQLHRTDSAAAMTPQLPATVQGSMTRGRRR